MADDETKPVIDILDSYMWTLQPIMMGLWDDDLETFIIVGKRETMKGSNDESV